MQGLSLRTFHAVRRTPPAINQRLVHIVVNSRTTPLRRFSSSFLASAFVQSALRTTTTPLSPALSFPNLSDPTSGQKHSELTAHSSAYLSRVASQTIRLACQQRSITEAYAVVKSIHYTNGSPSPSRNAVIAIDFGQKVSPRLASHCLLHGLIRLGLTKKAGQLALHMLKMNMSVRTRSLELTIGHLCETDAAMIREMKSSLDFTQPVNIHRPPPDKFSPSMIQRPHTRLATQIFLAARQFKHQRTKHMLQSLIDACLLQGEILVISFLVAFLLKQWQVRQAVADGELSTKAVKSSDSFPLNSITDFLRIGKKKLAADHYPLPDYTIMQQTLDHIETALKHGPPRNKGLPSPPSHASQALYLLGMLLDEGLIPFVSVSPLIKALYSSPAEGYIWVRKRRKWVLEKSQRSYTALLDNIVDKAVAGNGTKNLPDGKKLILGRNSYNSLLHYALRHQQSVTNAKAIVQTMSKRQRSAMRPDTVTMNILLRSGTLLRRDDIVRQSAKALNIPTDALGLVDSLKPSQLGQLSDTSSSQFVQDGLVVSKDDVTLRTYMSLLIASGKPHLVENIYLTIFPEMDPRRPEYSGIFSHDLIKRAVQLGPRFFAIVLNGLCKSGKIVRAIHLWKLAKEAENLSWRLKGTNPWCLPIEAYTVMMQYYASDCKRSRDVGLTARIQSGGFQTEEGPSSYMKLRGILGRRVAAERMGRLLYRSLLTVGRDMRQTLSQYTSSTRGRNEEQPTVTLPVPDARFFNATLGVFSKAPYVGPGIRTTLPSRCQWNRLLRRAQCRYIATGQLSGTSKDAYLMSVLKGMQARGLPIPVAYRSALFSSDQPRLLVQSTNMPHQERSPPSQSPVLHRLHTCKNRGLPLSRRRRRRPPKP